MRKHISRIAIILVIALCLPTLASCDAELNALLGDLEEIEGMLNNPGGSNGSGNNSGNTNKQPEKQTEKEIEPETLPEGLEVELDGETNTYTVKSYSGEATDVIIPARYNGKKVTSIADSAFKNSKRLLYVSIPDTVTEIGDSAFKNCQALKEVSIGTNRSRLESIQDQVFAGCYALETITFAGDEDAWNSVAKGKDWDKHAGKKTENGTYTLVLSATVETEITETWATETETVATEALDETTADESYVFPEFTIPEWITLPEDFSVPEDFTFPEDITIPEDFTLPEDITLPGWITLPVEETTETEETTDFEWDTVPDIETAETEWVTFPYDDPIDTDWVTVPDEVYTETETEVEETTETEVRARDIQIQKIQIVGDKAITMGGFVSLVIEVSNPDKVNIQAFVINGVTVSVKKASTNMYAGNYASVSTGGYENLVCEQVIYEYLDKTVEQETEFVSTESILILGQVSVESISVEKDCYTTGSTVPIIVNFKGSEGYDMKSVNVNINNRNTDFPLVKINDTSYYFVAPSSSYWVGGSWCGDIYFIIKVLSATYGLGDSTTTVAASTNTIAYGVSADYGNAIDISTPEQLQNMQSSKSYRLANDIDMEGFDWTPYKFTGHLDGNGFVIKNLTINQNYSIQSTSLSDEYYIGLFTECGGYITNLKLEDCNINITSKYQLNFDVGFLVGHTFSNSAYFSNCHVEGDISVIIQNGSSTQNSSIGGLAGHGQNSCFNNCSYKGNIYHTILATGDDWIGGCNKGAICGFRGDIANCISYSNATSGWQTDIYDSVFYEFS